MLKFIKHNMESILGIEIFPLIAFILFFSFFIGLLLYVWKMKSSHVEAMGQMPLSDDMHEGEITYSSDTSNQKNP